MSKTYIPALTERAIEERRSWQFRVVSYTHGNQTTIGAFMVAVLGRKTNPPCIHPVGMNITEEGKVIVAYKAPGDNAFRLRQLYDSVQELVDILRGLADALQLNDQEREDMFGEVRKFVRIDKRVNTILFD